MELTNNPEQKEKPEVWRRGEKLFFRILMAVAVTLTVMFPPVGLLALILVFTGIVASSPKRETVETKFELKRKGAP